MTSAQVLLTFFDMSARTHYLNARQTLDDAARVARAAGDQRERHDRDRRDLLRRQRLPRRAGGGARRRRRADPADRHRRPLHGRPAARTRTRGSCARSSDFAALQELEIGHTTSPLGSGGMRSKVVAADMATAAGIATMICNGVRPEALRAVLAGEREGTRFAAREARYSSFKLWLKYAKPSRGTLVVDAGAARAVREGARACCRSASSRCSASSTPATRSRSPQRDGARRARAHTLGKGICNYSAQELRQVHGHEVGGRARDAAARHRGGRAPRLPRGRLRPPLPCRGHGNRRLISRRHLPRGQARRARARAAGHGASRTPRSRRSPRRSRTRADGDPRGQRARHAGRRARQEIGDALLDRLRLDEARVARRSRGAVRQIAALRRPGRRGDRRPPPAQRPGRAQGARAAGRRRGRLRGAPERDDRRGRAVPEVGQRDRAARLLLGRALQRRARADRRRGGRRGGPARRAA